MRILLAILFCLTFGFSVFAQKKPDEKPFAPSFSVVSIDGKTFDSAKLKDKVVVINLWFINCPNCVEEIKSLNKIVSEFQDKGAVFIGLATNKKADLERFLVKNPFSYNIVSNATQTILSFGEADKNGEINIPFPMHIVVNRQGEIVVRTSGIKGVEAVRNELEQQFETK